MNVDPGPVPVALALTGMTKRFGKVVACDSVDFTLHRGEIHGVLGENGAGKSTLMRLIFGLTLPDRGRMEIDGAPYRVLDPLDATRRGIGMVHQHYSLVDALTVWENVALGEQGRLDRNATKRRVAEISHRYGLAVDPYALVGDLSVGIRQRVEIIKCLRLEPRIIILDEPTSVLSPSESEQLFDVLSEGVHREKWAVVLVSHKLDEVLRATDRITVMRHGRVVDRVRTSDADAPSLARAMVGRPVALRTVTTGLGMSGSAAAPEAAIESRESRAGMPDAETPLLRIDGASLRADDGRVLLDSLSLEVRAGEVVGVAGVEGNGQTPLADVLSSLLRLDSGAVEVEGQAVPTGVAGAMAGAGVVVVPADRHRSGCVPGMTVAENLMLSSLDRMQRRGLLRRETIRRHALDLVEEYGIHTTGPDVPLDHLSGGNQQRVVLARALSAAPKILVAHQPTRGLDVGAIEFVGDQLLRAAASGIGVVLLSTDLAEITALADRIVIVYRGRIVGEMDRANLDMERLALLMGGSGVAETAA